MKKFFSSANFQLKKEHNETPLGVSLCVDEQPMSIREILNRYTQGIDIGIRKTAVWSSETEQPYDDPDLEKVMNMDMADKAEMATLNRMRIEELNNQLESKKQEKLAKKQKDDLKKAESKAKKEEKLIEEPAPDDESAEPED
ncbi:MAG: hypothetical protein [Microviridae sp.]|nr:MAG: hypothetical protein [Microviridae sp.]